MMRLISVLAAAPLLLSAAPHARLEISLEGLRNARGVVRLCVAPAPAAYPDCRDGTGARRINVPAGEARSIVVDDLAPGTWAVALMHDENGNARLDTRLAIPVEGFGFSNNPAVGFGAPAFRRTAFSVSGPVTRHTIRLRYLL